MHQVCNMKSGTAAAKLKACTSLDEIYPEPPRQLSSEKLEFLESKKKEKLSVIAEKKKLREIKQSDRMAVAEGNKENRQNKNGSATKSIKAGRGKYIKKCLPFGPGGELENSDNFESCNEFIRLVQDIKKFCIVKAQNIDPTFDYAASRKKRSTEMTKPGEEDLEEDILDDEMDNEVDEKYTISQRLLDGHIRRKKEHKENITACTMLTAGTAAPAVAEPPIVLPGKKDLIAP